MDWAGIILGVIQLAVGLLEWLKRERSLEEAQAIAAGQQALRLLQLTAQGQALRAKLESLSDSEAAALWTQMVERTK